MRRGRTLRRRRRFRVCFEDVGLAALSTCLGVGDVAATISGWLLGFLSDRVLPPAFNKQGKRFVFFRVTLNLAAFKDLVGSLSEMNDFNKLE